MTMRITDEEKKLITEFEVTDEQIAKIQEILGTKSFVLGAFNEKDHRHLLMFLRGISAQDLVNMAEEMVKEGVKRTAQRAEKDCHDPECPVHGKKGITLSDLFKHL
jgi:hypothetical protein